MYRLIISIAFLIAFHTLFAQEKNEAIAVSKEKVLLKDFTSSVEQNTDYKFYYISDWVDSIYVNTSEDDLSLDEILTEAFQSTSLKFYIDSYLNVVIYTGTEIDDALPKYEVNSIVSVDTNHTYDKTTTQIEKRYIEGKKSVKIETYNIGNKDKSISGKSYIVSGQITDASTGEPVIGATVYIRENSIGTTSDLDGYFILPLKQGRYLVTTSSLSMKEKNFYLNVLSDGEIPIALEKELHTINEVKVFADKKDNVTGIQMGYERISSKNIKEIPVVMGEKDLLKVAQMLPGVQSAGEGSSGVYVRGGSADQNGFYINKLPIYNTSHLFGFFSAFSSDIVNSFSLYKSNIPAHHGGRVSSVFDISTRQGNKKEFFGKGGISPVTGHIAVEGPIVKEKSSFVLNYRATYSDWILSRVNDYDIQNSKTSFYDVSGVFNTELNDKNLLKIFAYRSHDNFSLALSDDYDYSNTGATIGWKHRFSSSLNADFYLISSQYEFAHNSKANPSEAYTHDYRLRHNEVKADFLYHTKKNHKITFGLNGILYDLNRGNIEPYNEESKRIPVELGIEKGFEGALYVSDEFELLSRLKLLTGLRYSFYSQLGPTEINEYFPDSPLDENNIKGTLNYEDGEMVKLRSGIEPRFALNYTLGFNSSVKASYNRLRQYIFMLSNTVAISPSDQWKLSDYYLEPIVADQVSLGYYKDFPEKGYVSSVEVYKKWTHNVVEYKDGVDFISDKPTEMLLLQGEQESYGIEFILKKNAGKLTGWLSYTYSNSTVQVTNDILTEQINYGKKYPSNYDKPHSLNLVTNYKYSRRLSFSTILVYSTGRPITYPMAIYYSDNKEMLHYSERNEYRIPDYFRIDFSINYEGNLNKKKWLHSSWMLNVYNLTGRRNAYSVYFEASEGEIQGYKLSVFGQPIVTLSWNFKFGNYVSD